MDLTSRSTIKEILKKHNVRPSKHLGQYFLIDRGVLEKIIEASNLTKKDTVIEIGPGIGTLTQGLAKLADRVIAVEKDRKMCRILKETLKDYKNVEIINRDVLSLLKLSFNELIYQLVETKLQRDYKVAANLPFYITSPVIRKFLESKFPPQEMVLLVQKEVAERICAKPRHASHGRGKPGSPRPAPQGRGKMSILAVAVQFYAKPEIVKIVSKKSFWPVPRVDSAILRISRICTNLPPVSQIDKEKFFRIVKAGFSSPRKQLVNNLARGLNLDKEKVKGILSSLNLNSKVRAQELSVENWLRLLKKLSTG